MNLFIRVFGKEKIEVLLADREFIGSLWLNWLKKQEINYCIRIKEAGQYVANSRGQMVKAKQLFHNLKAGETVDLGERRLDKAFSSLHHISASRCPKGELLVVIHSNIKNACLLYEYRWQIETMFKGFKSSGFNLEDTRVINYERLETLISAMAISFVLSYEIGDDYEIKHPPKLKKHGYKAISTYKLGINLIKNWLFNSKRTLIKKLREITVKSLSGVDGCWMEEKIVL